MTWLTIAALVKKYWYVLAGAMLLVFGLLWLSNRDSENVQKGVTKEVVRQQDQVIQNVGVAKDAEREITNPKSCARYNNCLRNDRNPAACERFLPAVQAGENCD